MVPLDWPTLFIPRRPIALVVRRPGHDGVSSSRRYEAQVVRCAKHRLHATLTGAMGGNGPSMLLRRGELVQVEAGDEVGLLRFPAVMMGTETVTLAACAALDLAGPPERVQRREHVRVPTRLRACLVHEGHTTSCDVQNLSVGGMLLVLCGTGLELAPGATVAFELPIPRVVPPAGATALRHESRSVRRPSPLHRADPVPAPSPLAVGPAAVVRGEARVVRRDGPRLYAFVFGDLPDWAHQRLGEFVFQRQVEMRRAALVAHAVLLETEPRRG